MPIDERPVSLVNRLQRLGARIATARAEKGWSQAELAQRAGSSRRTVVHLESGHPGVALGTALQVAWLLNLSLDDQRPDAAGTATRRRARAKPVAPDLDF